MQGELQSRTNLTTGKRGTLTGLCMECALRRHDFHQLIGNETESASPPDVPFPHALIDGRHHVLLSYVWTHLERCSECNGSAANLYVPMR